VEVQQHQQGRALFYFQHYKNRNGLVPRAFVINEEQIDAIIRSIEEAAVEVDGQL
jgi:hypothetical protein